MSVVGVGDDRLTKRVSVIEIVFSATLVGKTASEYLLVGQASPYTGTAAPLVTVDASEQRNMTTDATSAGSTHFE